MSIFEEVVRLRSIGRDVVSLCVGEPSAGPPPAVLRAAAAAHDGSSSTGYTPALGLPDLRERIAGFYQDRYGIHVPTRNVAVTTGSSGAFVSAFLAAFDAGDRVAVTSPGYPAYRNILQAYGCELVDLVCDATVRFQPTVEMLARAHAEKPLRGLVIASPGNPTGTMIPRTQLQELIAWADQAGVRVVSDEIYHGISFADAAGELQEAVCAWELSRSPLVVSSFSKYWGMTGWRLGWALMPDELVDAMAALLSNMALCPPAASQVAALQAFTPEALAHCEAAVARYARTRAAFLSRVDELAWGTGAPADGAFYYYADLGPQLDRWSSSEDYATALLQATGVAVAPGSDFDRINGHRSVRISFAVDEREMGAAVDRIIAFQAAG